MSHVVIQNPIDLASRFSNKDRLGWDGDSEPWEQMSDLDGFTEEEYGDIERELSPVEDQAAKLSFKNIEQYLPRIPPREADLIRLYHKDGLKQEQIARLFGITQAAVSYRLHRGIKRIRFLRIIPELYRDVFDLELGPKFNQQDREILWLMYRTTCQSEVAKRMGLTQGRVRHRFFRSLGRIKDLIAEEAREKRIELMMQSRKRDGNGNLHKDAIWWTPEAIQAEVEQVIRDSKFAKYWIVFHEISDKHFNILHEVSLPQFQDRSDAQILPIG